MGYDFLLAAESFQWRKGDLRKNKNFEYSKYLAH